MAKWNRKEIYISSTYQDLREYRQQAIHSIWETNAHPIAMESYAASEERPVDKVREDVRNSDIYIGIFAWRYGYVPESFDASITELEYQEAIKAKKHPLIFMIDDGVEWPAKWMDDPPDRIRDFRERLKKTHTVKMISSIDEFGSALKSALAPLVFVATKTQQHLPPRIQRFVGRTSELESIRQSLRESNRLGDVRQVALTGIGGIGKTSIALEYGWESLARGDYPGGVLYTSFDLEQPLQAISRLAGALGLDATDEPEKLVPAIKLRLDEGPRSLLILDNIRDEQQWLDPNLQTSLPAGSCERLITTRALHLKDVRMLHVDRLPRDHAIQLLSAFRDDASDAQNIEVIGQIVDWFDGLAVGLNVVGAHMAREPSLRWEDYSQTLSEKGLGLVRETEKALPLTPFDYQRRVDAVFDDLLDSIARPLLRSLEYASLLPEDLVCEQWLIQLLDSHLDEGLSSRPGFRGSSAERAVSELKSMQLLRRHASYDTAPSNGSSARPHDVDRDTRILTLHRVLRQRLRERLERDSDHRGELLEHVISMTVTITQEITRRFVESATQPEIATAIPLYQQLQHEKLNVDQNRRLGHHQVPFADRLLAVGRWTDALSVYSCVRAQAERSLNELPDDRDLRYLVALGTLGRAYVQRNKGEFSEAQKSYNESYEILRDLWTVTKNIEVGLAAVRALDGAAALSVDCGLYDHAVHNYRESSRFRETLKPFAPENWNVEIELAYAQHGLGLVLSGQDQLDEAEEAYYKGIAAVDRIPETIAPAAVASCRANLLQALAHLLNLTNREPEAEEAYRQSIQICRDVQIDQPENADIANTLAYSLMGLGYLLQVAGQFPEAEENYRAAVAVSRPFWVREEQNFRIGGALADALYSLGALLGDIGRSDEGEACCWDSVDIKELLWTHNRLDVEFGLGVARAQHSLGYFLSEHGQFAEAERAYRRSLEFSEYFSTKNPKHLTSAAVRGGTLINLGFLYWGLGRLDEAEAIDRDAVELFQKLNATCPHVAEYQENLARAFDNLGMYFWAIGNLDEAETNIRRTLEICRDRTKVRPNNVDIADELGWSLNNLAEVLKAKGQPALADDLWREAIAALEPLWTRHTENVRLGQTLGRAVCCLAESLQETTHVKDAEEIYGYARDLYTKLLTTTEKKIEGSLAAGSLLVSFARLYLDQGKPTLAEDSAARAVDLILLPLHTEQAKFARIGKALLRGLTVRGEIHQQLQQFDEAEETLTRAVDLGRTLAENNPRLVDVRRGLAVAQNKFGELQAVRGSLDKAEQSFRDSLTHLEALQRVSPNHVDFADQRGLVLNNLADLLLLTERRDEARSLFQSAHDLYQGLTRIDAANIHFSLAYARALSGLGYDVEAERIVNSALNSLGSSQEATQLKIVMNRRNVGLRRWRNWLRRIIS